MMETNIYVLDLEFQKAKQAIAAFLLETEDGLILVETGPDSTFDVLQKKVQQLSYKVEDIRHVLLTHIHFDHAGAAWQLAKRGAAVYVHPFGAKHLATPDRLWKSAKRIYGDEMETLWGHMEPIAEDQLREMKHGDSLHIGHLEFQPWHTPGHAVHHIAWQLEDILFTGDVAGVKIQDGPVVPPCPPPDINLEDWRKSIDFIRNLEVDTFYLTHFGEVTEINTHLDQLEEELTRWSAWIKEKMDAGQSMEQMEKAFSNYVNHRLKSFGLNDELLNTYEYANPAWMSVAGLVRYWKQKEK